MGMIRKPHKVKLVVAMLSNDEAAMEKCGLLLKRLFGRTDLESPLLDFSHTDYYREEMGGHLKRKILSFERTVGLKDICAVKLKTDRIEKRFSRSGKRLVNIDPGYVDLAKLVLFSTKDYSHRIYLGRGIYAEVTLHYRGGTFNAWPWTYPDYKSAEYVAIFNSIRELYKGGA